MRAGVQAVVFDADGVVQMPHAIRRDAWLHVLGHERNLDEFIGAVFEAERPALEGQADFVSALSDLMTDWACVGTIDDALAVWTMIEPDAAVVAVVKSLRRAGVHCSLATNQEPFRARFMSTTLGYSKLFDREFYSCRMGVSKPSVVNRTGLVGGPLRKRMTPMRRPSKHAPELRERAVRMVFDHTPEHTSQGGDSVGGREIEDWHGSVAAVGPHGRAGYRPAP